MTTLLARLLLPVVIGWISSAVTQLIKRHSPRFDALRPEAKQVLVAGWSVVLTLLAQVVGASVCVDGSDFCAPHSVAWDSLISYAVAVTLHGRKPKG